MSLLTKFLIYADILGPLLGLGICLFGRKRIRARGNIYILAYLIAELVTNSIAKKIMLEGGNNIWVYQFNILLSFTFTSGFFIQYFRRNFLNLNIRWVHIYAVTIGLLFFPTFKFEDISMFNSLSFSFGALCICIYCIVFFIQSMLHLKEKNLLATGTFYTAAAWFFYYATCFFIFAGYRLLAFVSNTRTFLDLWLLQNFCLFTACCILGLGYIKIMREKVTP